MTLKRDAIEPNPKTGAIKYQYSDKYIFLVNNGEKINIYT